jgi:tetratricopeptide (TPR) repeat protein
MVVPPGKVLDEARAAATQGDYAVALERYELFFDRALIDQGEDSNYYGVRLSYCLSEWARLGEKHGPARKRLEEKANEALSAFETTKDSEKFHDFQAISGKLGRKDQVLDQFVKYHESRPELAGAALWFMWDHLVEARRWHICAAHLGDWRARYQRALGKFDQAMEVCNAEPSLGGEEFADQIRGWYVRDVSNLLAVLKNTDQHESAEQLGKTAMDDMQRRGHPELIERARAALQHLAGADS